MVQMDPRSVMQQQSTWTPQLSAQKRGLAISRFLRWVHFIWYPQRSELPYTQAILATLSNHQIFAIPLPQHRVQAINSRAQPHLVA